MIFKYRKKPVDIEAIQFDDNFNEIEKFCGGHCGLRNGQLVISTTKGAMLVSPKDYVIKGINGDFYPCKPDIFDTEYEVVYVGVDLSGGSDHTGWTNVFFKAELI